MAVIRDRYILDLDIGGAQSGIDQFKNSLMGLVNSPIKTGLAAIATATVAIGTAMIQASRDIAPVVNQLRLVTDGSGELLRVQQQLREVVARSGGDFRSLADLYTRVSLSTEGLGKSQSELIRFTEQFSRALTISGADANTANGAITQLAQAMGSGVVRGDEFRSIVEALGPALAIIARDTGLTVPQLRAMAEAGQLTSEVFLDMIANSESLSAAYQEMGLTATQMEGQVREGFDRLLVASAEFVDEITGLSDIYKSFLAGIRDTLNDIAEVVENTTQQIRISGFDLDTGNLDEFISLFEDLGFAGSQAATAVQEVDDRIAELQELLALGQNFPGMTVGDIREEIAKLEEIRAKLQEVYETARTQQINLNIAGLDPEAVARIQGYSEAIDNAVPPMIRLQEQADQVRDDIAALQRAMNDPDLNTEGMTNPFGSWDAAIAAAEAKLAELNAEMAELRESEQDFNSFPAWFDRLMTNARQTVAETEYLKWAIEDLESSIAGGGTEAELAAWELALARLNEQLANEAPRTFQTILNEINAELTASAENMALQQSAMAVLNEQYLTGAINIEQYRASVEAMGLSFEQQMISTNNLMGYIENLRSTVESSMAADEFKAEAIQRITDAYNNGTLGLELYAGMMRQLGVEIDIQTGKTAELQAALDNLAAAGASAVDAANERIARSMEQAELSGLTGVARQIRQIELEERRLAEAAKDRLRAQFGSDPALAAELERQLAAIDAATAESVRQRTAAAQTIDANTRAIAEAQRRQTEAARNAQKSFSEGWSTAFDEYTRAATDAARTAESVFNTATSGMEDMLMNFFQTGELNWKDYAKSIVDELLRANVKQITASFWGSDLGQGLGGLFGALTGNPDMAQQMTGGRPDGTAANPLHVTTSGLTNSINQLSNNMGNTIKNSMGGFSNSIGGTFNNFTRSISGIFSGFGSTFSNLISSLLGGFSSMFGGLTSSLGGLFGGLTNSLGGIFSGIGSLFGGGGSGGGFFSGITDTISNIVGGIGNLFSGFFADGGFIPAGRFGVVGEAGPELVGGPAQITPLGTGGNYTVNMNINAVDALSFRELVARDPGFIYAVAQAGSRTVPMRG